mgnify:CR=1 FL=1
MFSFDLNFSRQADVIILSNQYLSSYGKVTQRVIESGAVNVVVTSFIVLVFIKSATCGSLDALPFESLLAN